MVARVDKKLSTRSVSKDDYLDFLNRELIPLVEKLRLWTDAIGSFVMTGDGDPEGAVKANRGTLFLRRDGAAGTCVYYKSADDGAATGWLPLP